MFSMYSADANHHQQPCFMMYSIENDEALEGLADDDTLIEFGDATLVVDPLSYQYLVGSTVDYEEGLAGACFRVQNPNATTTRRKTQPSTT